MWGQWQACAPVLSVWFDMAIRNRPRICGVWVGMVRLRGCMLGKPSADLCPLVKPFASPCPDSVAKHCESSKGE